MTDNQTLNYYDENAQAFVANTINADISANYSEFELRLQNGASILDFGCGSGRDTKYFHDKGYAVDSIDGSEELCKLASEYSGVPVKHKLFQELDEQDKYDGIWACSSILHLPKTELKDVFRKMLQAMKDGGVIYTSFKYSEFEGERNGRYFTDFTEESFTEYISDLNNMLIEKSWITGDVRPGRGDEKWLNLILRKSI